MLMRAYVLTYHSGNSTETITRRTISLRSRDDLDMLRSLAIPVVPLSAVVAALLGAEDTLPGRVAAITLDDGLDFDFVDLVHPYHGPQASVNAILARHEQAHGARLHATAFVIASPQARRADCGPADARLSVDRRPMVVRRGRERPLRHRRTTAGTT